MTISAAVETITPSLAVRLLDSNTNNRQVKLGNVMKIERAILAGDWKLNGEAIKISESGSLLDGQHRLKAVVNTGMPIESLVIRGLAIDTMDTMDAGAGRSAADALKLRGYKMWNSGAAVARLINLIDRIGLRAALQAGKQAACTVQDVVRTYESTPDIDVLIGVGARARNAVAVPASLLSALYREFAKIDSEDAAFFFDRLTTGENMASGDPIFELRKALAPTSKTRLKPTYACAVFIKAWNKFRDGEQVGLLRFRQGGALPEAFPEPH